MRQFGYVQSIPAHPVDSWVSFDDIDDRWMHYSDHLAPAGDICVVPGQCAPDYIDWFFLILHPFMTAPQTLDPPRDASITQPKHIPQVPESRIPQEPLTEILFHERKAIIQLDLWFPSQQFLCFCNVWFSLTRIVRSVLNHIYLHFWIDKLHNHT